MYSPLTPFYPITFMDHLADKGHLQLHAKTVSIEGDEINALLCTLRANTLEQTNLALVFGYDVPVNLHSV